MERYRVGPGLLLRMWEGEDAAVVRSDLAGRTHLLSLDAFSVLEAVAARPEGMSPREVAAELLGPDADEANDGPIAWVGQTLDALSQAGLLAQIEIDDEVG